MLQILTAKCLGRRVCKDCGKNFNVADIMLPATEGQPEVRMPPLNPPENCRDKMEIRSDDNLETINNRIEVSKSSSMQVCLDAFARHLLHTPPQIFSDAFAYNCILSACLILICAES